MRSRPGKRCAKGERVSISVAINTLNEEQNLPFALRSVRTWADQIVVVDMHSSDRTREIASELGAEVYLHEPLGFADPARAFAIEKCRSEWILILDADELIPQKLSQTLLSLAATSQDDIVSIPRVNYMLGERLNYTGWGPASDHLPRFFRRGKLQTNATIHNFFVPAPGARTVKLPFEEGNAIVHFNYVDLAQFIDKLNRYTTIEAEQAAERGERPAPRAAALRATREFVRRYVRLGGYRDGWRGFYLSLAMAFYRIAASGKLQERNAVGTREAVLRRYAQEAEAILAGYGGTTPGSNP
jgi:(heptosyl)LPS beta-1,4-glucosyltransferase